MSCARGYWLAFPMQDFQSWFTVTAKEEESGDCRLPDRRRCGSPMRRRGMAFGITVFTESQLGPSSVKDTSASLSAGIGGRIWEPVVRINESRRADTKNGTAGAFRYARHLQLYCHRE